MDNDEDIEEQKYQAKVKACLDNFSLDTWGRHGIDFDEEDPDENNQNGLGKTNMVIGGMQP